MPLKLITILTLSYSCFAAARFDITLYGVHLQLSPFWIGALVAGIMVLPVFVCVPSGRWADRGGFRRPAVAGILVMVLSTLLAGVLGGVTGLIVVSVLSGAGYLTSHVAINQAIGSRTTPQNRSAAFAAAGVGFSLASATAPVLAGLLIDQIGHRLAFAAISAIGLAALLMLAQLEPDPVPPPQAASVAPGRMGDLVGDRRFRGVLILSALISVSSDLFPFLIPLNTSRLGISPTHVGLLVGAFGAGMLAVRLCVGWLARSFPERLLLFASLGIAAAAYAAYPVFLDHFRLLVAISFLLGMALGGGQPVSMSMLHAAAPAGRAGEAQGIRSMLHSGCHVLFPLIFGALASVLSVNAVFWLAAALIVVGAASAWRQV